MAGLWADGVFGEIETGQMHKAYGLALAALELTHSVNETTRHLLADCLIQEMMTQTTPTVDIHILAATSVERFIMLVRSVSDRKCATVH